MSTSDKVVANDTMPNVRADINVQLAAIASQQAGTSDPSAMLSYERQARTDLGLLRRRNAANSGWVIDGTLAETFVIARSSNTILGTADHERLIAATSTFTQTLTAAATLGDGWHCFYRNDGTGVITIDPNSSETIDGAATLALYPGDSCAIFCDGFIFKTVGLRAAQIFVGNTTRDISLASGTQVITGVGFKARVVDFQVGIAGGGNGSFGRDNGSTRHVIAFLTGGLYADTSIALLYYVDGSNYYSGVISAVGDDGFTITWTKVGSPTGTIQIGYKAER